MSKFSEAFGKLKTFVTEFSTSQITTLNGIIDKVPETMKASFTSMRDSLVTKKAELEEMLKTVPGDEDGVTALQSFFTSFTKLREHADSLATSLQSALTANATSTTALQGLEKKVADGDLMDKDKVKALTDRATQDGVNSVMPQLVALRKESIALAGLPELPETHEIYKLPADKFSEAVKLAKANVKTLTDEFGFALQGKGDSWVKDCAWLDSAAFQGSVNKIKALLPAKPGEQGDPMLGNSGPGMPTGKIRFA